MNNKLLKYISFIQKISNKTYPFKFCNFASYIKFYLN